MTSSEDLSPEAKHLLRQARGADRATRSEVTGSVQRFQQSRAPGAGALGSRAPLGVRSSPRRATPWAVFAAILSGTLGAYATVGQSLGLPVPGWWMEFTALPAQVDTATNQIPPRAGGHGSPVAKAGAQLEPQAPALPSSPPAAITAVEAPAFSVAPPSTSPPPELGPNVAQTGAARAARREPVATNDKPALVNAPETNVSAPEPISASALRQEVQSITAARDALAAGNYALAQRHLDDHRAQFPGGALSAERQALSMICQCRSGRGTAAAAAYVGRRPTTPLTRRVATECGLALPSEP